MLRKIGSRWWLIILSMIVCVGAAAVVNYNRAQFYTGRTTLLEVHPPASSDRQAALNTLGSIATSNRVMQYADETLRDLRLNWRSERVYAGTNIRPVKDTYILAVEVTLPDPTEAKVAADVVGASVKKFYNEFYGYKGAKGEPSLKTVDPAHVFPVNQRKMLRLVRALIEGLVLGIVLAAILPKGGRRESDVAIRTESSTS